MVTLSMPATKTRLIHLRSAEPSRLIVPHTLEVRAGQSSLPFLARVVKISGLTGTQNVTVDASCTSYSAGQTSVAIIDDRSTLLSVTLPATGTTGEGVIGNAGVVSIPKVAAANITVQLESLDTNLLNVPPTAVIPKGKKSGRFNITLVPNNQISGFQAATVEASVANWTPGAASIQVFNNQSSQLTFTAPPSTIKGSGVIFGTLTRSGELLQPLSVSLSSSLPGNISLPSSVTIPSGVSSVSVPITVASNQIEQGELTITLSASAPGLAQATALIVEQDTQVDHFGIALSQNDVLLGIPFNVTLTAYAIDGTLAAYLGTANLSSTIGSISPVITGLFNNSTWTGPVTLSGTNGAVELTASSGRISGISSLFTIGQPPKISLSLQSISTSIYSFQTTNKVVQIENQGGYNLTWSAAAATSSISPSPNVQVGVSPTSGILTPTTATSLQVGISAPTNISSGTYQSTLEISSSDPTNPILQIPVSVTILPPPIITLLLPASTTEGDGTLSGSGTLKLSAPLPIDVTVSLVSSMTNELQVPPSVLIPAGMTNVTFNVTVENSGVVNGTVPVTVSASAGGTTGASNSIAVADGTGASLQVNLPSILNEQDLGGQGTVTVSAPTGANVTVQLSSSDPSTFAVPATVTITNGTTSATFPYSLGNALATNASEQITVRAQEAGWTPGAKIVVVTNDITNISIDNWAQFGNNPAHTGVYTGALKGGVFKADWGFTNSNSTIYHSLNSLAIGGGQVFVDQTVYFETSNLQALNEYDGSTNWIYNFASSDSINPPSYYGGSVYVQRIDPNENGTLICLNASSGQASWISSFNTQWGGFFSPTVCSLGIFINGGYYGGVYGFNFDGSQRFFAELSQYDGWTPSIYNGILYTWTGMNDGGDTNGYLEAFNPTTGTNVWSLRQPYSWHGWTMDCAAPLMDNIAFLNGTQTLSAVNITNQTALWTNSGSFTGTPAVANGKVYVISNSEVLILDEKNGARLGAYTTQDTGLAGQPVIADDSLVVSSGSATYIFDLASQTLLQTIPFGGNVCVAGGSIYIASTSSNAMAVYRPTPVISNEVAAESATSNTVSWAACPGATAYEIQMATNNNFSAPITSGWITNTSCTFSGLTTNNPYYFRAHAKRSVNGTNLWQSPWSDLISVP